MEKKFPKYYVHDGLEVFDTDNQVRYSIEKYISGEVQRKFSKMVMDSEQKAWEETKAKTDGK